MKEMIGLITPNPVLSLSIKYITKCQLNAMKKWAYEASNNNKMAIVLREERENLARPMSGIPFVLPYPKEGVEGICMELFTKESILSTECIIDAKELEKEMSKYSGENVIIFYKKNNGIGVKLLKNYD